MKKVRRFNGEDDSYVSDENLNQLRQDQTDRMMRIADKSVGSSRVLETPTEAPASRSMASAAPAKAEPAAAEPAAAEPAKAEPAAAAAEAPAAPKAKPPIVTLQQLNAFKKEYGADKDLTDYMNQQQGLKRRNAPSPSTPSSSGGSGGGRGPTAEQFDDDQDEKEYRKVQAEVDLHNSKLKAYKKAEEEARSEAGKARRAAMEKSQALEAVYPEQALLGGAGFGIKSIAKTAQNLANRGGVKEVAKRIEPTFREAEKQLALPKPTPRLGYDKAGAKAAERSGRAAEQRTEMLKENARRSGLREDASAETSKAVRDKLGGNKFKIMKKGGAVKSYASGGSVSSASKRADGCAIRGKTRA